ncbi:WD repeat-containing protein 74 [Borealophlyctis nickersoniae]|nr:WD repeat-containing protein 74 [Borealophlyctis nickersoniae]
MRTSPRVSSHPIRTLITCTDLGIVRYQHAPDSQPSDLPDIEATLGQDLLFCMQVHPAQPHIFATGGDERDLCVWDITKAEKVEEGGLAKLQPIWKAKNVKNDFLDLRVPVWITNLRWLSDTDTTRIVVGTGYHQIRVYDTKKARRPVLSVEIGEHPVRSLCPSPDGSEAVFSDTTGKMTIVQLGTGKTAGTFSNLSGAVTAIHVGKDTVVTVGLDRFLRIYERKGRKALTTKAYLKQRLTTLLVDEDYVEEGSVEEKERTREDGDDELWAEMDAVTEEAGPAEERKAGKRSKIKSGKRKVAVPDDGME